MDNRDWKENFDRDGFIFYPGFLNEQEMVKLSENVDRYIDEIIPTMPPEQVYFDNRDDPDSLKQIQEMFTYDDYFHKLMFNSKFEELAATLLGQPVTGFNMQYFNKAPGTNRPTPVHQDGFYWKLEPNEGLTMWLAMDHVGEENGCVRYVRGSHKRGTRPHGSSGTLGFSQTMLDFPNEQDKRNEVYFTVEPGDLLVHHALTIHWADGNRSRDRTRKALGFIYFSQRAKRDINAAQDYQEKLNEEWKAQGRL